MRIHTIGQLVVVLGLLGGCKSTTPEPQPTTNPPLVGKAVTVPVSEAGAAPYDLNDGRITNANYKSGAPTLTITGKLNSGKVLTLTFSRAGSTAAYSTNVLEATLGTEEATSPTGSTTYDPVAQTVDGKFKATFASVGLLEGSFSKAALQ